MSNDKRKAEAAAAKFLKEYKGAGFFAVNRQGWPWEHRTEVQWLLRHGYIVRERSRDPFNPRRRFTRMLLRPRAVRLIEQHVVASPRDPHPTS